MTMIKTEFSLWEQISMLPNELKRIIGSFSSKVKHEKYKKRLEYFKEYSDQNLERVLETVLNKWTKTQILWVLEKYSRYSLSFYTKKVLVTDILRCKLLWSPEQSGTLLRIKWQRLRAIEIANTAFEQRKRKRKHASMYNII